MLRLLEFSCVQYSIILLEVYFDIMFGSHLSIAGGMERALQRALNLKLDCVQVFTKNQRQWKTKPLSQTQIDLWSAYLKELGWLNTNRVVSHNSYLVNMASPDRVLRKKSICLQQDELERCEVLGIPLCVAHPGARLGVPRERSETNNLGELPTKDELNGLSRIVKSINEIHNNLPGYKSKICLETTVGSGTNLGYDFQHLGWIRENIQEPGRLNFCFDTCHVTASGYDMTTKNRATAVLEEFNYFAGLENIAVFHFNDSVGEIGSRTDRHAHIGQGNCGLSCFRTILEESIFDAVPKILETPKEEAENGKSMDKVNIAKLRKMASAAKKSR